MMLAACSGNGGGTTGGNSGGNAGAGGAGESSSSSGNGGSMSSSSSSGSMSSSSSSGSMSSSSSGGGGSPGSGVPAIRKVIAAAIEAGGSSLRDHRKTDGDLGMFQHRFRVYDREGEPCPTRGCDGTVRRFVQNGRSTFFCPVCQK